MVSSEFSRRSIIALGGIGSATLLAGCAAAAPVEQTVDGQTILAKLADIPVGGAVSATLDGTPLLISQPTKGNVVAFNAVCPHQGCRVMPEKTDLECPCHQSRFNSSTGALIEGPSPRGLDPVAVKIDGDSVVSAA